MTSPSIGIDTVEISRFRALLREKKSRFFENTFTKAEQQYCDSYKDAATHYAGTFAAKEAVRKLSSDFHLPFTDLEVHREKDGKPVMHVKGKRKLTICISITHTRSQATAIAIR